MSSFKELDPSLVRQLLEGHENVLAPEIGREQDFIKSAACPSCGGSEIEARVNSRRPFTKGLLLPNKIFACLQCGAEFEPYSRIISKRPTAG